MINSWRTPGRVESSAINWSFFISPIWSVATCHGGRVTFCPNWLVQRTSASSAGASSVWLEETRPVPSVKFLFHACGRGTDFQFRLVFISIVQLKRETVFFALADAWKSSAVLVSLWRCSSELNVTVDFPRDANSKSLLDRWSVVFAPSSFDSCSRYFFM